MSTVSVSENQRKRTLDALQRRFATETELLSQQNKSKKTPVRKDIKETPNTTSPAASSLHRRDSSITTPSNASSKKAAGSFSKSNHAPSQDPEESGLAYSQLQHSVHESLLPMDMKFSSGKGSVVDKILHELLQSGDSAKKYMQGSRVKLDNWILLDNYVQAHGISTGSQLKELKIHSKKRLSMKKLKKCGMLDLPKEFQKFDKFRPMHDMWNSYVAQLLKTTGKNQLVQCLLAADLHGAMILVAECKTTAMMTGVSGIMIRETAETLGIITQDDKFRVVPKRASVFIFQVDSWKITLQGDKLASRNISS